MGGKGGGGRWWKSSAAGGGGAEGKGVVMRAVTRRVRVARKGGCCRRRQFYGRRISMPCRLPRRRRALSRHWLNNTRWRALWRYGVLLHRVHDMDDDMPAPRCPVRRHAHARMRAARSCRTLRASAARAAFVKNVLFLLPAFKTRTRRQRSMSSRRNTKCQICPSVQFSCL